MAMGGGSDDGREILQPTRKEEVESMMERWNESDYKGRCQLAN